MVGLALALGLSVVAIGCPSPDPEGKYGRFNDETKDDRLPPDVPEDMDTGTPTPPIPTLPGTGTGGDTETDGPPPLNIDGVYLVAVSTVVEPTLPLQFLADVDAELDHDGNGPITVVFQPLSLEQGSTTSPREEVGDAVTIDSDVSGYSFDLPFGPIEVTGEANPITGAAIQAEITLSAHIVSVDSWCGDVDGEVMSPLQLPLTTSTFGAIRLADRDERPADGEFPLSCEE